MVLSSDIVIMSILVSMLLFFVVVVGVVIIHVFITARSVRRALVDDANNNTTATTDPLPAQTHRGYSRPRMSQADLDKLPSFNYNDDNESKSTTIVGGKGRDMVDQFGDCAVCLDTFKLGEKCRVLPLCKHSFHAKCVDGWLLKIPVCPICRDNVALSSRRIEREEISGSRRNSSQFSGEMSLFCGSIATTESTSSSRFSDASFVTVVGGGRLRSVENGDVIIEMVESNGDHVDVIDRSLSGPPRSSVDSLPL
ncbi:unnamed protein product [Linum tenue]|uniref:RING-type E3 ubiquitin transferase n=1 Tax=Linum tenue TaxID=586396 RepID=A0AAV0N9U3_9ROSI|nr:unnamed protein product [Linum tenue]